MTILCKHENIRNRKKKKCRVVSSFYYKICRTPKLLTIRLPNSDGSYESTATSIASVILYKTVLVVASNLASNNTSSVWSARSSIFDLLNKLFALSKIWSIAFAVSIPTPSVSSTK